MSQYFSLTYTARKENGDSEMDLSVSFENPGNRDVVMEKINTWLNAIGYGNCEVVTK